MGAQKIRIAVLGASGYSGAELVRLLAGHPGAELVALGGESAAGRGLDELYPALRGLLLPPLEKLEPADLKGRVDLVFLALPHTASMAVAPKLLEAGLKVIDLSGDFRLRDAAAYEAFYKQPQSAPALLKEAVYGLCEIHGERVRGARLIANPGCYTTTAILALYPLLRAGLLAADGIVIDAKSGVTGAGRKLQDSTAFASVEGNFSAYKAGGVHQHIPELEQELSDAAGRPVRVVFTPHLLPLNRGIFSTAYAAAAEGKDLNAAVLTEALKDFYAGKPFVRVLEGGALPSLRAVVGTNMIEMAALWDARARRAVIFSATDNLLKGAAGQAVQNMNLLYGLPETSGLDLRAYPV